MNKRCRIESSERKVARVSGKAVEVSEKDISVNGKAVEVGGKAIEVNAKVEVKKSCRIFLSWSNLKAQLKNVVSPQIAKENVFVEPTVSAVIPS